MNNNLRYALAAARLSTTDVAAALTVDPKTVSRWLNGRIPYPRHRYAIADLLQVDEGDLWPETTPRHRVLADGVQGIYPHRWAVPQPTWRNLFSAARQEIGILAYSALFLAEDAAVLRILTERATAGVKVRILLGDPEGPEVATRGTDEGIGAEVMAARVKNALTLCRPLLDAPDVEIRLHHTVLYNSIYRADDQLLVNTHAYGTPAANAPVMHLTHSDEQGPAATYLSSFNRTWTTARPHSK
ncbi:XRE family transcriptional regulator [Nonomuraea sp. MG754425]|uniref:helix-turn-helix domain-containing protein n=1 Tax=Nonomuraea sp. MG754425 TaxID=2570319 RepID=UPI001F44C2DD|nr:helix-turn-helix domain-containing protein [Nonomuraea sp. MG754425]MCF6467622.1 XRE family transcriptional regulator [Nonomuraea sp. MG754425]